MTSRSKCPHQAFVVHHDVERLSKTPNSRATMFAFKGRVTCYDCGLEFEPFRVKLIPLIGQGEYQRSDTGESVN